MKKISETNTDLGPQPQSSLTLMKDLEEAVCKAFRDLCSKVSTSVETTFDNLLEYVIWAFTPGAPPLAKWPYSKAENTHFLHVLTELITAYVQALQKTEWHDFFGVIYEKQVAGILRKSGRGQYFSPKTLCEAMANVASKDEADKTICDIACGSGRLLLAGWSNSKESLLVGVDVDRTCCLMTVANCIFHGAIAVVTRGNSLVVEPGSAETWIVNESFNDTSSPLHRIPHCRHLAGGLQWPF